MKAIDCHCHIYPAKIAKQASESVGEFYEVSMYSYAPTGEELLAACEGTPIKRCIVHSVALKPSNVEGINDFIAEQCRLHPEFIGFATMHPDYPDPEAEIDRAIQMGLKGLKLHPDMQHVDTDDPRLMRIYEIIEGRIPLMVHCGDARQQYPNSHPKHLVPVLRAFPKLVVDAAHMGGWGVFDEACELLAGESCFLDVSSSQPFLSKEHLCRLVRAYGTERVMFGSDFPMWSPAKEYEGFVSNEFTQTELEDMLWNNCERYLGFALD